MAAAGERGKQKISELEQAVRERPDSAEAHLKLGTALLHVGAISRAEVALRRAVELDESSDAAMINLGGVLLAKWDFAGCIEVNRKVAERSPDLLLAHYNQGLGHLYLKHPEEMVSCFRRVVEIDPDHAGGQYHLAVGLLEIGEVEQAREALDRAVSLGHSPAPEFLKALEKKERPHKGRSGESATE
jgi:Flp pilus assembly protein TadD